ncbi:OmpA family protein [Candidatus Albibeggiatoa sp. nov. NOAA]|uniref:OmpA/MotB family protein n=1 Tax=Candidatus Albibeggiatoa sp. nov. NOAA TaxID=3162724 RepID=UPI0032FB5B79|nr:OmpA family protein [Thiotrichaceae bacterium]
MKVNNEWMNISDLMSGLMMIFLFIAIAFMLETQTEQEEMRESKVRAEELAAKLKKTQDSIKEIAVTYRTSQQSLNLDLTNEFQKDLKSWGAEITKDNIVRFHSPDVLFEIGSSKVSARFQEILRDFFPRYIAVLTSEKYINEIDEIRVEGHTSNDWNNRTSDHAIYLNNMKLSQNRANSVLTYCYGIQHTNIDRKWLEKKFRANGMSFSKLIYQKNGQPDAIKSRRVEFKVLTNAQEKIYRIVEQLE